MRWAVFLFVALIFPAFALQPASGQIDQPTAIVSQYSVNPPVLSPDGLGTITVSIKETGAVTIKEDDKDEESSYSYEWLQGVEIERVSLEGEGLAVLSPSFHDIGRLGPEEALRLTFTVRAPAKSGIYYPKVHIITSGGNFVYPLPVNVNTPVNIQREAIVVLWNTYPESPKPGDDMPVTVTVENDGKTIADEVILKIGTNDLGISPKTNGVYYLGTLQPGEQKVQDIVFVSERDARSGMVHVPATLSYTLINGSSLSESVLIDLLVKGVAELEVTSMDTSPEQILAYQPFDVSLKIDNSGTGKARQVSASIDLSLSGTLQSFVGTIEPDGNASADFSLYGGPEGIYQCNASITYADDTGTHTVLHPLTLAVTRRYPDWIGLPVLAIPVIAAIAVVLAIVALYLHHARKTGRSAFPWWKKG